MLRRASAVEFAKHQIALQRTRFCGLARNREQGIQQLTWVLPVCGPAAPVANSFRIRLLSKDFLLYVPGNLEVWKKEACVPRKRLFQCREWCVSAGRRPLSSILRGFLERIDRRSAPTEAGSLEETGLRPAETHRSRHWKSLFRGTPHRNDAAGQPR